MKERMGSNPLEVGKKTGKSKATTRGVEKGLKTTMTKRDAPPDRLRKAKSCY